MGGMLAGGEETRPNPETPENDYPVGQSNCLSCDAPPT